MATMIMKWAAFVLVIVALIGGCEKQPPAAATSTAGAPKGVDWSAVKPAEPGTAMGALCRVCRLADVFHKGKVQKLTVTFVDGKVVDEQGNSCVVSASEWKGILALIEKSPSKIAAGRALPAKAHNYADGLGAARRHAYEFVPSEGSEKLQMTLVKPLEDDSQG